MPSDTTQEQLKRFKPEDLNRMWLDALRTKNSRLQTIISAEFRRREAEAKKQQKG